MTSAEADTPPTHKKSIKLTILRTINPNYWHTKSWLIVIKFSELNNNLSKLYYSTLLSQMAFHVYDTRSLNYCRYFMHRPASAFNVFLLCWLIAFSLASISHTYFVLQALHEINVNISVSERVFMMISDWWGLLPGYGAAIAVTLILACVAARIFTRLLKLHQRSFGSALRMILGFTLGGLAMLALLLAMKPILNVTLIAGARTPAGLLCQCLAGAIGVLLFVELLSPIRFIKSRNASK